MASTAASRRPGMTYDQARRLVLLAGLAVLLVVAVLMYARRVDGVEVAATLLFIPVFIAFVLWHITGGIAAGVLASVAYVALRYPAIDAVGVGQFAALIASRTVAYIAFGAIGGWANRQLEASLVKLELFDQIDDDTGLYNARFFLSETDLEAARAKRYGTIFSVAVLDVRDEIFGELGRRRIRAVLKELGGLLDRSIRAVDRACHGKSETSHSFAIVLPETGPDGASVFAQRLAEGVREHLAAKGLKVSEETVSVFPMTYPGDEARLEQTRERFTAIDRRQHPD
jgi:diguanylate cyclase (GGDEF)-like protein